MRLDAQPMQPRLIGAFTFEEESWPLALFPDSTPQLFIPLTGGIKSWGVDESGNEVTG